MQWIRVFLAVGFVAAAGLGFVTVMESAKLVPADGTAGAQFAGSAAAAGSTAVFGAEGDSPNGAGSGSAYVAVRTGTTWSQQAKIVPADGAAGDGFGKSVAVSADTLVVGSPRDDDGGADSGSAYVYVRSGTAWSLEAKLTASDAGADDLFGFSVAVSGNGVVVGSPQDDDNGVDSGSAYVFVRTGTTWSEVAKLSPSDGAAFDYFGGSVAISGGTILVGSSRDDDLGNNSGSAYVFLGGGATWNFAQKLTASDGEGGDNFGFALSVSGGTAVIGSPKEDDGGANAGAAYVFRRTGGTFVQEVKLMASDGAAGDQFGLATANDDEVAVVGSPLSDAAAANSGAAYVYVRSGTLWTETSKLVASDGAADDLMGIAVGATDCLAVAGSPKRDEAGADAGAAYAFDLTVPVTFCTAKVNSCGTTPVISAAGTPSATATSGYVISGDKARGPKSNGSKSIGVLLYTESGRAMPPPVFGTGLLCLATPLSRANQIEAVGGTNLMCDATFQFDMNAYARGLLGGNPKLFLSLPGNVITLQWWGRDTFGHGEYLSDGLEYVVCP